MMGNSYTLQYASSKIKIPPRRIQFYIKEGVVVPDGISPGRGTAHRFSVKNLVQLYLVKKLSQFGITLALIKKIMGYERHYDIFNKYWNAHHARKNKKLYLIIVGQEARWTLVGEMESPLVDINMDKVEVLSIINISKLLKDLL